MIMKDKRFKEGFTREYLKRYEADSKRIVFEITEREKVKDRDVFWKQSHTTEDKTIR